MKDNEQMKNIGLADLVGVIIAIIIVAVMAYAAGDMPRRSAEARNAQRLSAARSLHDAYLKYTYDNRGVEPAALDTAVYMIGDGGKAEVRCAVGPEAAATTTKGYVSFTSTLLGRYLSAMPRDPMAADGAEATGYYIQRSAAGEVIIGACNPEPAGDSQATAIFVQN